MNCRSCGATNATDARFCSQCGTSLSSAAGERRVVSVLFADIVGFTALAEHKDPEEVKYLVDQCFAELTASITAFGGVVDKIIGDAIVALFGAPIAHEDDPERAVRAALAMQKTVREMSSELAAPIQVRIGVNTGEALVGSSTTGGDYTAMGDVMNSAARLEQLADPGQVLVGGATKEASDQAVRYRKVGELEARGREEPIDAWLALEPIQPPGAHRVRSNSFYGRERELKLLESQGLLSLEQGGAQVAVVVGDAGMGKSRLARKVTDSLVRRSGSRLYTARCVPYGEANVWWPVAELVRQMLGLPDDTPRAAAERWVRNTLVERFADIDPAPLDRIGVALLHALGYPTALRGADRTRNRAEVTGAFNALVEHELTQGPVILSLSDMHWAGDAIWELLDRVLKQHTRRRLLLVATARSLDESIDDNPLLSGRHGALILRLGPLDDASARQLLGELDPSLTGTVADQVLAKADGNPFFLEELASLMVQGELNLDDQPSRSRLSTDGLRRLPGTLRGIVAARLDALTTDERGLLEDASVIGSSGTLDVLALLDRERRGVVNGDLGIDDPFFTATLDRLVTKDLLAVSGSRFEFRSDLIRDVAYGTLTKAARARAHFRVAEHVERRTDQHRNSVVVAIAAHYRAAAHLSSELAAMVNLDRAEVVGRALHWLTRAGERALQAGEPADAERWFNYGVDLATDDDSLAGFLLGRARARCEVHDLAGSRADLARLESVDRQNPNRAAEALLVKGDVLRKAGDLDQASAVLRETAAHMAALNATDRQALALRLLGLTEMARSDNSLARQALEASRRVAAENGDRRGEAWALQSMAWHAFAKGRAVEANRLATLATELFIELGDRGGLSWAQGVQAWVSFHLGQWDTARELLDGVLPETRRRGDPWAEAIMVSLSASLDLWSGRATAAVEQAREAQTLARRADDINLLVQSMALEGRALVSLGQVAEGGRVLGHAFGEADAADDAGGRRMAIIANCASAARLGESERTMRWAARLDQSPADGAVGEADLVVALALAFLQRGAVDDADSQLAWMASADPDPSARSLDLFAEAVRTVIAATRAQTREMDAAAERVLDGSSTYLDRILALMARACDRHRSGDGNGSAEALERARAEADGTDDVITGYAIELVAAICGQGDLDDARSRMRNAGVDPSGLEIMWTNAARQRVEQV